MHTKYCVLALFFALILTEIRAGLMLLENHEPSCLRDGVADRCSLQPVNIDNRLAGGSVDGKAFAYALHRLSMNQLA